jgi:hypothetical protein
MPTLLVAENRTPVRTYVVKGANRPIVVTEDYDRVPIKGKGEKVAGMGDLTGESHEEPTGSPDGPHLVAIEVGIVVEGTR